MSTQPEALRLVNNRQNAHMLTWQANACAELLRLQNEVERLKTAQPAPSQYGSPELQAMVVARAIEKDRAAQPAPWVGLTLDEKHYLDEALNLQGRFPVIEAIEAKLREKNGAEQQEEQVEQVEQVVEPTPQERRDAGQWHCPECYTFGHQHRRSCSLAKKGGAA